MTIPHRQDENFRTYLVLFQTFGHAVEPPTSLDDARVFSHTSAKPPAHNTSLFALQQQIGLLRSALFPRTKHAASRALLVICFQPFLYMIPQITNSQLTFTGSIGVFVYNRPISLPPNAPIASPSVRTSSIASRCDTVSLSELFETSIFLQLSPFCKPRQIPGPRRISHLFCSGTALGIASSSVKLLSLPQTHA